MKEEVSKAKDSVQVEWNKKYKLCNVLFCQVHCNQRLEKEKTNLQRKLSPNFNRTESIKEKEIMDKPAKENIKTIKIAGYQK